MSNPVIGKGDAPRWRRWSAAHALAWSIAPALAQGAMPATSLAGDAQVDQLSFAQRAEPPAPVASGIELGDPRDDSPFAVPEASALWLMLAGGAVVLRLGRRARDEH